MDKEACDAIAFMATILGNLTRGYSIEVEDIWKLDEIAHHFDMRGENDGSQT